MFLVFGDGIQLVVVQHTGITVEELGTLGVCFGIRNWYLVGVGAIRENYSRVFGILGCVFGNWGCVFSTMWCHMRGLL